MKIGQIAHVDRDNSNHSLENLVWLCRGHHDAYDTRSQQTKGFQPAEVKQYRSDLYALVATSPPALDQEPAASRRPSQAVSLEIFDRRLAIYREVRSFLLASFKEGTIDLDALRDFGRNTEEALFLFDSDVASFIDTLCRQGVKLRAAHSRAIGGEG